MRVTQRSLRRAGGRPFGRPTALRLVPVALHHLLEETTHRKLPLNEDAGRDLASVRRQRVLGLVRCASSAAAASPACRRRPALAPHDRRVTHICAAASSSQGLPVDVWSMSMGETRDAQLLGAALQSRAKHVRLSETQIWESPIRDAKNLACE